MVTPGLGNRIGIGVGDWIYLTHGLGNRIGKDGEIEPGGKREMIGSRRQNIYTWIGE